MGFSVEQHYEGQPQNVAQSSIEHTSDSGHEAVHAVRDILGPFLGPYTYWIMLALVIVGGYFVFKKRIMRFFKDLPK